MRLRSDFSQARTASRSRLAPSSGAKWHSAARFHEVLQKTCSTPCTKSEQGAVDGLHSPENTSRYKPSNFIDSRNRRSTKTLVLRQLLRFTRLVRRPGLKRSHSSNREARGEGEQGSIAKRWLRRTRRPVGGKIEFRGVEQVCPVGGEPGARAKIALMRLKRKR